MLCFTVVSDQEMERGERFLATLPAVEAEAGSQPTGRPRSLHYGPNLEGDGVIESEGLYRPPPLEVSAYTDPPSERPGDIAFL